MIKRNSLEWKTFIERLEAVKLKSNREVLCFKCWQMLNCKQKVKHLKKMPKHGDYLITSTKYASESQILELARAHNKIHLKDDGEEYLVSPYGGTLAETILEQDDKEDKYFKPKPVGKVQQNLSSFQKTSQPGFDLLENISERLRVLEQKVDTMLHLMGKDSAALGQLFAPTSLPRDQERTEGHDIMKTHQDSLQRSNTFQHLQPPRADLSLAQNYQSDLINGLFQSKPTAVVGGQTSLQQPYFTQLQQLLLGANPVKQNLLNLLESGSMNRADSLNQNLSGAQAVQSDRQQFNVLNSINTTHQGEGMQGFKILAASQVDRPQNSLKRKITQIYPQNPIKRMNTQGSQSSARQNLSMAEEEESGTLNPPQFGLLNTLSQKLAAVPRMTKTEEELNQEFSFESDEEDPEEDDPKMKQFVAKINMLSRKPSESKLQPEQKMIVDNSVWSRVRNQSLREEGEHNLMTVSAERSRNYGFAQEDGKPQSLNPLPIFQSYGDQIERKKAEVQSFKQEAPYKSLDNLH